ncbi:MAG: hypothetical protein HDT39_06635 [Lachnospiraceae bacterium]|nr:hypothetical protein [Lachnospiraceae bacterium]
MYSENEFNRELKKYDETGSIMSTIVSLGYPSRCNIYQWYFGMKIHASVDVGSLYVYTITDTSL